VADVRDCFGEEPALFCAVEARRRLTMTAQGGKKRASSRRSVLEGSAWLCGTGAPSRSAFYLLFFFFLLSLPLLPLPKSLSLSALRPLTNPHRSAFGPPAVGRNNISLSTLAPPAKVRRFTSAATLKTQTRCRSQWGRRHRLRVALDMLP
jgi:hypothetical protein